MLVLSRGPQDKIVFPNLGITVEILRVNGQTVRVGVDAPKDIDILRHELLDESAVASERGSERNSRSEWNHQLRNRLNSAQLMLFLMEKQLNAGHHVEALESLRRAIHEIDVLDGDAADARATRTVIRPEKQQLKTLLVEDDTNECELLAGYLRLSGYEVDTAQDGLQAMLQLARRDRPNVVLLDMHMPRMDGAKTVRSIRSNPDYQGMKVFAVTGSRPEDIDIEIGPRGVDRWFFKPIKPQELVNSLNDELLCATSPH